MTRDDIILMAREAGFDKWEGTDDVQFLAVIERFAALVAAAEREVCARTCEELMKWYETARAIETETSAVLYDDGFRTGEATGSEACAEAIRARGEK